MSSSSSFQQARLAEQLRLSNQQSQSSGSEDEVTSTSIQEELLQEEVTAAASSETSEEARNILASESEALGPDGMPFAPMVTYQKYLTMQVSYTHDLVMALH